MIFSSCIAAENSTIASVKSYLSYVFLEGQSLHPISPLLELVSVGNMLPESFYRRFRNEAATTVEGCIVSSLCFLRSLLLELRVRRVKGIKIMTLLERAILEKKARISESQAPQEIINVIAKYIEYDFNLEIPLVATNVLTLLCSCHLDDVSGDGSQSFIRYFGDDAARIVKGFAELAGQNIGEKGSAFAAQRESLSSAIFKFVCVVFILHSFIF